MPPKKNSHKGIARGQAKNYANFTEVEMDNQQASMLMRHLAEALSYQNGVSVRVHYRRRGGKPPTHRIEVRSS